MIVTVLYSELVCLAVYVDTPSPPTMEKDSQTVRDLSLLSVTNPADGNCGSISTGICPVCKGNAKTTTAVLCPVCHAPHHASCASKFPPAPNGGFKKCCGPSSPLPSPQQPLPSPLMSGLRMLIREEFDIINNTIASQFKTLNSFISDLSIEIKTVNEKVDTCSAETRDTAMRVDALEDKFEEINNSESTSHISMESCLSEVEDRLKRRNNLIIYGIDDPDPSLSSKPHEFDFKEVTSLFTILIPNKCFDDIKVWRIGKFSSTQTKPRPLKIILPNDSISSQLRTTFLKLKRSPHPPTQFATLSLTPDRTKFQQLEYQRVKRELISRNSRGEKNIKITCRLGAPIITTI